MELGPLPRCSCTCGDEAASGAGATDGETVGPVEGIVKAIAENFKIDASVVLAKVRIKLALIASLLNLICPFENNTDQHSKVKGTFVIIFITIYNIVYCCASSVFLYIEHSLHGLL